MPKADVLLDKLREIKTTDNTPSQKRKKAMAGAALIGAAGGGLLAINRGYNMLTSIVMGAIVGGMAAHLFLPKDSQDDEDEE
jgi:hypothetical protein